MVNVRLIPIIGRISANVFEKWLNPEDEVRTPSFKALTAFCAVMGSCAPLNVMVQLLGGKIIEREDVDLLAWARMQQRMKTTRAEIKKLEAKW